MKKQEFDITKLSNTILESIVKRMLKEITTEEIHIAVETAILRKKYIHFHKNLSESNRFLYCIIDNDIFYGIGKREILLICDLNKEKICTEPYREVLEDIIRQDTDVRDYRKYPQLYYNLYSIMPEQTSIDVEEKEQTLTEEVIEKQEIILASQYPEIIERYLSEKIPWIVPIFIIYYIICICIKAKEKIAEVEEFRQKMNVKLQRKEDIFFVESDSATVYSEPSVHADIVGKAYYSDEVSRIDNINMWDKIFYYDENGDLVIGWITSKSLISYQEWMNY